MALLRKYLSLNSLNTQLQTLRFNSKHPVGCKVVLITGASVGIGEAFANAVLKCGAKAVMLGDVREKEGEQLAEKLNETYGENKAFFLKTDVTITKELNNLFECTIKKHKFLDIVVNNAGLLKDKEWEKTIAVNINGLVRGTLMGFDYMGKHKKGRGGIIINVASIYGLQSAWACPIYCGTKHFIIGLNRCFSNEYYEKLTGVKVLTICPGVTDTEMISEAKKSALEGFGDVETHLAKALGCLPTQPAEACGHCLLKMICDGKNGGVWVSEDSECYKIELPNNHHDLKPKCKK